MLFHLYTIYSCLVAVSVAGPRLQDLKPELKAEVEELSLKNEKGFMLGAAQMYCEDPDKHVSTYNSRVSFLSQE